MYDDAREIIRLLTEMRDAQREELAYRRRAVEESLALQRRAIWWQRVGMIVVFSLFAGLIGLGGLFLIISIIFH